MLHGEVMGVKVFSRGQISVKIRQMENYYWLVAVGFLVGAFGTLIGAGGGFLLVPILLLLYPQDSPELITSISLAVVFANAASGSLAYARMGRIDYRSGMLFSAATVPGAVLGALTTAYIPRRMFDLVFGAFMIVAALFLILRPKLDGETPAEYPSHYLKRRVVEANGMQHAFSYNPVLGVAISLVVGYLSSLLGIGGGIIHVPALVHFLNFPTHVATATSHFILTTTALTGTVVHVATGTFSHGIGRTVALAIGVIAGAQLGARVSSRVRGTLIMRGLAVALAAVGTRILLAAL